MNPEHPAHGEVKVEQRHRDVIPADIMMSIPNYMHKSIWQRIARFEQSLTTPPATDLIPRLDQARSDALAAGEAPHIPYDWLVETIAALRSPPATDVALRAALKGIGEQIAWWLRYTRENHEREGMPLTEDTHVIPPTWPSYGQLTKWLGHLILASAPTPPDQPQIGDEERVVGKAIADRAGD